MIQKTPEEIMEILGKMQFFGGQRAGRELWMDKPKDIQDADIESFNKDINNIRAYIHQLEEALLLMVYQYCSDDDGYVSHRYMVAGEHAFAALGIENYCSIETIEKKLDEMEGIHITPPARTAEGGIKS